MEHFARRTVLKTLGAFVGLGTLPTLGSAETVETDPTSVFRTVADGYDGQTGRGIVRVDPETLDELGVRPGDPVAVGRTRGGRGVPARIWRSNSDDWGEGIVRIGLYISLAAGVGPGDDIKIRPIDPEPAQRVVLESSSLILRIGNEKAPERTALSLIKSAALGRPIIEGTKLPLRVSDAESDFLEPYIWTTDPVGHVRVAEETDLEFR